MEIRGLKLKPKGIQGQRKTHMCLLYLCSIYAFTNSFLQYLCTFKCTVYLETIHNASLVKHFVVLQNGLKYFLPQNPAYNTP